MKEIKLSGLEEILYQETLHNGLEIYLLPYENKKNYYITYATKYGSDVLSFVTEEKEEYTPPLGIAHYLEHKMFEEPSGEDPFTFFSYSGSDGNAATSYDNTQYTCSGTKAFKENLKYLIEFVNNPYFTDENVEKEKGIIAEEIKMYQDLPDYQLEMNLRENLYWNSPRKYDVAGTIREIRRIKKEDLYQCYHGFYIPNNMFLLITGNFDKEEAMKIVKETLEEKKSKPLPKILKLREKKEVVKEEETIYQNIEIPKVGVGIKVPKDCIEKEKVETHLYLNMLTTILFGASSEFRERVREDQILNDIYMEWEEEESYHTFYLFATSTSPDQLLSEIEYELSHISITSKAFERVKKVWIATEIKMMDIPEKAESNLFEDIINYGMVVEDRIDLIRKMNVKEMEKIIKKLDLSNRSTIKMLEKRSKKKRNYDS